MSTCSSASNKPFRDYLSFKDLLEDSELDHFVGNCPKHRKRIFTPDAVLISLVGQALNGSDSCKNAVENVLIDRMRSKIPPCSLNTSSYVRARLKLPLEPICELTKSISSRMEKEAPGDWKWKNRAVRLIDGSTVAMSDTKENQLEFPQNPNQKKGQGYPLSRISLLTSLETGSVLDFAMGPFMGKGSSELSLARGLLGSMNAGEVLVGDAFYTNYSFISMVMDRGVDFVAIKKKNAKFVELSSQRISADDRIIRISRAKRRDDHFSWVTKAEYEEMPETLRLRETTVRLKLNGFRTKTFTIVSTLLNYEAYTAQDIADLYFARWNIETDLRHIKRILNMDFLKSKTPAMVRKECWTHLLAYNLVRRVMIRIAKHNGIKARLVSFKQCIVFIEAFFSKVQGSMDRYYVWKDCMPLLGSLAIKKRPERFEPRAIKNRRGNNAYPDFEMTRAQWKLAEIWPYLLEGIDVKFSKSVAEEIEKTIGLMII